ncbi:redoxin domain-containing protein [Neolewinella aurantiaca]|uniref:Redoxin domain-containing protein n=1 Tax=Neolewinella aurantiaca TaxID=2602767 RepID=A0A5C7FW49_9BACT|nr:redoxin domain-containing protein [Neolewinella aurantiaca]TXF90885.1 redoxin domain-containing protein [Neolewinella aurantiaca]
MHRFIPLLFLWLSGSPLSAQLTTMTGDEAPPITPTEYLENRLKKSDLKDKFLVLTLCKTWDQPCFNDIVFQDSLRAAYPSEKVEFLTLFRGSTELALSDIKGKNLGIQLATDLYGKTQIHYGDGETGLISWPLTLLIDDQNTVRWQGNGDDLTAEALERFVNKEHPIIDISDKYVQLAPESFLFEPMTFKDLDQLYNQDSVDSFVRVWDKDDFLDTRFFSVYSHDMGAIGPMPLEDLFHHLFPRKRLIIPGDLMEKEYRVAFVHRSVDRKTADQLAIDILGEIGLSASVSSLPATYYELTISDREKLASPRKVSLRNRLPEEMKDLGNYSDRDLHNFEIRKYDLNDLAKLLNSYSPDRWSYTGNHHKEYNFVLDVSSTKALLKSLRKHGISAAGKAGTIEEITLERKQ